MRDQLEEFTISVQNESKPDLSDDELEAIAILKNRVCPAAKNCPKDLLICCKFCPFYHENCHTECAALESGETSDLTSDEIEQCDRASHLME